MTRATPEEVLNLIWVSPEDIPFNTTTGRKYIFRLKNKTREDAIREQHVVHNSTGWGEDRAWGYEVLEIGFVDGVLVTKWPTVPLPPINNQKDIDDYGIF